MFLRHPRPQCRRNFAFLPGAQSSRPLPLAGPASPPPRWVLAPAPPWQCPGLRRREQLPRTPRTRPKFAEVRDAGGKPRGTPGRPSADAVLEASVSRGCRGRMGLAWREQRGRGRRSAAPGGRRRAPAQRVLEPAGCPRGPAAADSRARPARLPASCGAGLGGPRARHVAGFCPGRAARLTRPPAPARPSPAEARPPRPRS